MEEIHIGILQSAEVNQIRIHSVFGIWAHEFRARIGSSVITLLVNDLSFTEGLQAFRGHFVKLQVSSDGAVTIEKQIQQ